MRRVCSGLLGTVAILLIAASGVSLAQAPAAAGPAAVPADAKKMKSAVASSAASIEAGAELFQKRCRFCHGNTGKGDSTMAPKTMQPSNLTDPTWVRGSSEGEIFWVIQNGAPPKYDMKGLKGKISETDTWNLVNYVRSLGGVPKSH
jgi:mono/diheme cytochrome c family protein